MRKLRNKGSMLLTAGVLFQLNGTCLPENYFALTVRQIAVSLADAAVNTAIVDIADQLGLTVPVDNSSNTTGTTDPDAMP